MHISDTMACRSTQSKTNNEKRRSEDTRLENSYFNCKCVGVCIRGAYKTFVICINRTESIYNLILYAIGKEKLKHSFTVDLVESFRETHKDNAQKCIPFS